MRTRGTWHPAVLSIALGAALSQNAVLAQGEFSTRMVEIENRMVRVVTAGIEEREQGQPVVIFASGSGSAIESWNGLLPAVIEFAPVLAYDRPGIGRSEATGKPLELQSVAKHLHALLEVLDVP